MTGIGAQDIPMGFAGPKTYKENKSFIDILNNDDEVILQPIYWEIWNDICKLSIYNLGKN